MIDSVIQAMVDFQCLARIPTTKSPARTRMLPRPTRYHFAAEGPESAWPVRPMTIEVVSDVVRSENRLLFCLAT